MDTDVKTQEAFFHDLENKDKADLTRLLNNLKHIGLKESDIDKLTEDYYRYFQNLKSDKKLVSKTNVKRINDINERADYFNERSHAEFYFKPTPKVDESFNGIQWRLSQDYWKEHIPIEDKPIKYLEIGTFYGANVVSVSKTYCKHPDSQIFCIDPWLEDGEYKQLSMLKDLNMNEVYTTFLDNISSFKDKVSIHRGYSEDIIPTFEDNFFDIIYVDGNHDYEWCIRDALLSLPKLKVGGFMIFDDYDPHFKGVIDAVTEIVETYKDSITLLSNAEQAIIKKISS